MRMDVEFTSNSRRAMSQLMGVFNTRLEKAGIHLNNQIRKTLTGSRSGKTYRVPHTTRKYRASKPGEAPAVRTGELRNSYRYKLVKDRRDSLVQVGSPLKRAVMLENGTSRMKARPHFLVTFERERRKIKSILMERVD